jgi:4-amino-4-deoxy-L-arabinose transferase-like glycosyltransferase
MLAQSLLAMATIAATLALLPWLARRAGLSEWSGWLAAFVLAVLPINYFYESFGDWEQPLAGLVFVGLCGCFLELRSRGWQSCWLIAGTGLLTGVAALLSPSLVPAVGLMIVAEVAWPTAPRRRILAGGFAIVSITALLVAPWIVRNDHALGGFVPLRSNFGLELWFGNHDGTTGSSNVDWSDPDMSEKMRHPHPNADECQRLKDMGELAYMRSRQAEAVAWISEHPGEFVLLTCARVRMFWFPGHEMFNNRSLSTTVKMVGFGAISVLMFAGLFWLVWTRHRAAGVFAAALFGATFIYFITHIELRYRLPIHAVTGLLAAEIVVVVAQALTSRDRAGAPRLVRQ